MHQIVNTCDFSILWDYKDRWGETSFLGYPMELDALFWLVAACDALIHSRPMDEPPIYLAKIGDEDQMVEWRWRVMQKNKEKFLSVVATEKPGDVEKERILNYAEVAMLRMAAQKAIALLPGR